MFFYSFYSPSFSKNVFQSLLRGREKIRKKTWNSFRDVLKIRDFFDRTDPSTFHHPSIHSSIQPGSRLGPRRAGILRQHTERITTSLEKSNKSHIKTALGSWLLAFGSRLSAFGFMINRKIFQLTNFLKVRLKKWG